MILREGTVPPNKELKLTKPSIMELRSLTLCWADLNGDGERAGGVMKAYPMLPYASWPTDARSRELEAQHTFGMHLFQHVVDAAHGALPANLSQEARDAAAEAIDHTVGLFLSLLEGIPATPVGDSGEARYVLTAEFSADGFSTHESFGVAPDGDGVLMGYAGWKQGDFGQAQRARRGRVSGSTDTEAPRGGPTKS